MVSSETPSQDVPSFDHRVTQCRSTVKVSVGKSRNDFQSHRRRTFVPSSITNSHWSSGMCGVGPADKTGKSVVRYCPGGSFTSAALRRPEKPREMAPIFSSPLKRTIAPCEVDQSCRSSEIACLQRAIWHACTREARQWPKLRDECRLLKYDSSSGSIIAPRDPFRCWAEFAVSPSRHRDFIATLPDTYLKAA